MNAQLVKNVANFVIGACVGTVISNAIKATTPVGSTLFAKSMVFVGSIVLGGYVSELATTHFIEKIEDGIKTLRDSL